MLSDKICAHPWDSSYITATRIVPCCRVNPFASNPTSLPKYWNSPELMRIRSDMMSGREPLQCSWCFDKERHGHPSLRTSTHRDISALVQATTEDGRCEVLSLQHVEFRFSNICNFKCRTCSSVDSSLIAAEDNTHSRKVIPIVATVHNDQELINEFSNRLVSSITFSGGEPLMHQQHWDLLQLLVLHRKKPALFYNSNGSILTFKTKSVIDLWNHFDDVNYIISIDCIGNKAEYWRHGSKWKELLQNINTIRARAPHVKIGIHVTVSWVTAFSLKELVGWALPEFLAGVLSTIDFSPALGPFGLTSPDEQMKLAIAAELETIGVDYPIAASRMHSLIDYMYSSSRPYLMAAALRELKFRDTIRGEEFLAVFPEHTAVFKHFG